MNAELRTHPHVTGERLLTKQDLAKLLKVSQRTIHRWTVEGRLPEPVRFSKTCIRWHPKAIQEWLEAQPR